MHKIEIKKLGPIDHCEMEIKDFVIFTGPQASGKSTVAKSVFFFRNIKNILFHQIRKRCLMQETSGAEEDFSLKTWLLRELNFNFQQIFGTARYMEADMELDYVYHTGSSIHLSLTKENSLQNEVKVEISEEIEEFLRELNEELQKTKVIFLIDSFTGLRKRISAVFSDDYETVYIPAGRSLITLLSAQLNYIYSAMDDMQKRSLDYCTQNYLERILQLKPNFSDGIPQTIKSVIGLTGKKADEKLIDEAKELMRNILSGEYRNVEGEEQLQLVNGKCVKINFASSGQQEAVWILNTLFYQLLRGRKTFFIIEEPESNLFPDAQKWIADFIALVGNSGGNQILVTTHSPYILGEFNNLLYANRISPEVQKKELAEIIPQSQWLSFESITACYIHGGKLENCVDTEFQAICNGVIDGASEKINRAYERMQFLSLKVQGAY